MNPTAKTTNKDIDESIDELINNSLADKEVEADKKNKKPRGKKAQALKEEADNKEFIENTAGIASSIISMIIERMANPKPLTEIEITQVDWITGKMIDKYAEYAAGYHLEITFVSILGMIFVQRTNLLSTKKKETKESSGE